MVRLHALLLLTAAAAGCTALAGLDGDYTVGQPAAGDAGTASSGGPTSSSSGAGGNSGSGGQTSSSGSGGATGSGGSTSSSGNGGSGGKPPGCPLGYTPLDNASCYRIDTTPLSWDAAEKACELDAVGSHLVVVDSPAENNALPDYVWIGYTERINAGTFLWVNGSSAAPVGWATGEPVAGGAACTVTRPDGWHDDNCPELKPFVCEYDGIPANPSTF